MSTDVAPTVEELETAISAAVPDLSTQDQVIAVAAYRVLSRGIGEHPGTFALSVPHAVALAHHHAERTFGDALRDDG